MDTPTKRLGAPRKPPEQQHSRKVYVYVRPGDAEALKRRFVEVRDAYEKRHA